MVDSPIPLHSCPKELIPVVLEVLATEATPSIQSTPITSEPSKTRQIEMGSLHEKIVVLKDEDFDHLMTLFSHTLDRPFSCHDAHNRMDHILSFVEKPEVLKLELASNSKQYTVRVQLMKVSAPFAHLEQ